LFIYAWFYIQSTKIDLIINNEVKEKLNNLKAENQKLEAELQMMTSSKKIEQIACEKYGFKTPTPDEIFIINKSKKNLKNLFTKKLSSDE
jgi:cell division protein FtsB